MLRIQGENELTTSDLAAACGDLACDWGQRLFCRRHGAENTFGFLAKSCSVSLRLSDARGRYLEKTGQMPKVQNEIGEEKD